MEGALIILSSPSGAGKTTLVKKLSNLYNFEISISYKFDSLFGNRGPNPCECM